MAISEAEEKVLRDRNAELETSVKERDTKMAGLEKTIQESEGRDRLATAQKDIAKAINESKLPDKAKAMLIERHKELDTADGFDKIIEAEVAYLVSLSDDGAIKGLGETKESHEGEADDEKHAAEQRKIMFETFFESNKREGKSDEEAKSLAESAVSRQ